MAKQRRPPSRPMKPNPQSGPVRPESAEPAERVASAPPQRRSTYFEAVALYERGLDALQRHEYRAAIDALESVLRQYPDEKELHERVRLYLNICQRQAAQREDAPQTVTNRRNPPTPPTTAASTTRLSRTCASFATRIPTTIT